MDILFVNAVEAAKMGAGHVFCLACASDATQKLSAQFDCAIVTAGGEGFAAWGSIDRVFKLPAKKIKVISSHGAGGAIIGALAAELARCGNIEQPCKAATDAAAQPVAGRR